MKKSIFVILLFLAALSVRAQTPPLFSVNAKYVGYAGAGGGTANAQTVTYSPGLTAYIAGQVISWVPANANTGAATLNAGTPGAKSIVKAPGATALVASDLITTNTAVAIWDGTYFELQNPQTEAAIISGIVDGLSPVTVTTSASCTLGTTSGCNATAYSSGYTFNEEATAATAVTYTLPAASAGKHYCVANAYNGSAANTGTLELLTAGSGQYVIFTDGTLSASGGYVISGGAAADAACVVGVDSTHWLLYTQSGTWAKH